MSSKGDLSSNAKMEISKKERQRSPSPGSSKGQSKELVLFTQRFNRKGSLTSGQSGTPSSSRILYTDQNKSGKLSCNSVTDEVFLTSSLGPDRLKSRKTSDSSEGLNEAALLKKATEIVNIGFGTDSDDIQQCMAERLRLGDDLQSISEATTRSDPLFPDELFEEMYIDTKGAEPVGYDKISHSYVPFQSPEKIIKESAVSSTRTEKGKKSYSWSSNFFGNKTQIVGFFYKPVKKKKKKHKKRSIESDISHIRFLDPPVSYEEDIETKEYIHNFYFYLLQLIMFSTIALGMVTPSMFYFNNITKELFFEEIRSSSNISLYSDITGEGGGTMTPLKPEKPLIKARTISDFWNYAESTLINLLYWNFYYSKMDSSVHDAKDDRKMFNENQILGVARLRQLRVENNSCTIHSHVRRFFQDCYTYYSVFTEDTRPIKEGMENNVTATAWVYTDVKKMNSTSYWGDLAIYGGGGYYLDLAPNKLDALQMLQELRRNRWLGKATRALFIDFSIYNANVNLFCLCKMVLEFPPVGGLVSTPDFRTFKLIRYLNKFDFFILALEITYMMFVLLNALTIIRSIYYQRAAYFYYMWNYMDILIFLLTICYIILNIVREVLVKKFVRQIEQRYTQYTELSSLRDLQIAFENIIALIMFLSWVKLFSFLNFNKALIQFRVTLKRSLKEMVLFAPMFLTMYLAFAFLAFLLFGSEVSQFQTVWSSLLALLKAFLGEFNYDEVFDTHRILGPIFYATFVFFIFFVLVNVFVAIVTEAYSVVRSQVIQSAPRAGNYVKRAFVNLFTCFRPMKKRKLYCRALKKRILFCEIEKALKRAGFQHEEIQIFFHKYNINCRNFLDDGTKTRILKDLELKSVNFTETSHQFQINLLRKKINDFNDRMDHWESKLQPVLDKVDILLHRL